MKILLLSLIFLCLILSCEDKNSIIDEALEDNDQNIDDADSVDELSFEFTSKTSDLSEKTSRDIVSCGDTTFVCGESSGKAYVASFKNGQLVWKKIFDTHFFQSINSIACGKDGFLYTVGDLALEATSLLSGFIQSINNDGEVVWEKSLDSGTSVSIYAITTDSSGNILIGGRVDGSFKSTESAGEKDGFIAKYDGNGELIFITQFGTPAFDSVQGITIGSDGYILASGHSAGDIETGKLIDVSNTTMKAFVVKFKTDGTIHWKKMYDSTYFWKISGAIPYSFFVAGSILKEGKSAAIVYKIGLDGKITTVYNLSSVESSTATGLAFDDKKNLYVTGHIEGDFASGGKIPPVKTDIPEGNNIFFGIFNGISSKLLYSEIIGGDSHDINPKIAVDAGYNPNILFYSVESLSDSSGKAKLIRLEK